jgi:hypothetical protein
MAHRTILLAVQSRSPSLFAGGWRRPEILLLLMAAAAPIAFSVWMALLNNFSVERAAFTGAEIGILQSLREVPGFMSFAVVVLILIWREQTLAYLSLIVLGIGTAITGYFPSVIGLYLTTVLMSIGFHYYETVQVSVSLQWIEKDRTPEVLGRLIAAGSFASIATFVLIWLAFDVAGLDFHWVYLLGGGLTAGIAAACWVAFPKFPEKVRQHRHMVLRRRYWLYYLLIFMSGARRQIFIVFAGFLMVEKFGFTVSEITLLFLLNSVINVFAAPRIGRLIGRFGERRALIFEYAGLIVVFAIARDRAEDLFPEDRRPRRHRVDRRRRLHHQPHLLGRDPGGVRADLAGFPGRRVPCRRGDGGGLAALVDQRALRAGARQRGPARPPIQRCRSRARPGECGGVTGARCAATDLSGHRVSCPRAGEAQPRDDPGYRETGCGIAASRRSRPSPHAPRAAASRRVRSRGRRRGR